MKKGLLFFLFLIAIWLFYAQCGMQKRINDAKAKKQFAENGISLTTADFVVNGNVLHYAKTGADTLPTLFFVHGSPGSWVKFGKYLMDTDLLKKYRMISIDRPGFGYSNFGHSKRIQDQSDIISRFLLAIKNGKPVFAIGRSYGGPMIAKLAVDNPGYFSGLIFCAAALDPEAERKEKWRPLLTKFPLKYFVPGAWRPSNQELWWLKKELYPLSEKLKTITCPVIIFHGDKDKLVPVSNAAYAKKMLINAASVSVTIIPGGGHHVSDDYYELVKAEILKLTE